MQKNGMYFQHECRKGLYCDCRKFRFWIPVVMDFLHMLSQKQVSEPAAGRMNGPPTQCSVVEVGEFFRFIAAYPDITEIDFENRQRPEQHFHVAFASFVERIE